MRQSCYVAHSGLSSACLCLHSAGIRGVRSLPKRRSFYILNAT
jgi:hypothetical protein